MRRLKWLLQIWFMWQMIKIIKSHREMDTMANIAQNILKYPAVNRDDIIKYLPNMCNDGDDDDNAGGHTDDDETTLTTAAGAVAATTSATKKDNSFEILKVIKNIVQQIQKTNCGKTKSFLITATTTWTTPEKMPQAKIVATSERSLQNETQKQLQKQHQEQLEGKENQFVMKPFSILEQLKLDQAQIQQEDEHGTEAEEAIKSHQNEKLLQLQQMLNMQHTVTPNGKATKKKKKKKKKKKPTKNKEKKKKRKQKPSSNHVPSLVGQPAHVLFASLSQKPQFHQPHQQQHHYAVTTKRPQYHHHQHTIEKPLKKIKYILRKNTVFKKKKKEYLNHLKHVIYPFVKFIAFFTILNPFTLAVFLFSLISPVVFGFLGFVGLSFLIKPALNLLFGVKRTVNSINRKKQLEQRKRDRLRNSRRPITIHKHYYQQRPIAPPPPPRPHRRPFRPSPKSKVSHRYQHSNHQQHLKHFNPILPHVRQKLKRNPNDVFNFKGYEKTYA